jgi:hypothetical protein
MLIIDEALLLSMKALAEVRTLLKFEKNGKPFCPNDGRSKQPARQLGLSANLSAGFLRGGTQLPRGSLLTADARLYHLLSKLYKKFFEMDLISCGFLLTKSKKFFI